MGSGKTTVLRMLVELGAHGLSADELARELMEPGTDVFAAIVAALIVLPAAGRVFWLAAAMGTIAGIFIVGAQLILFALAPLYYGRANRGTGVGAAVAVGRLGSIVGPLYAGALLSGGGGSARVLTGIVPFVAIAGTAAFALCSRRQCAD